MVRAIRAVHLARTFLVRVFVAVSIWAILVAVFMGYSLLRPSGLALAALGLLVLWWFYIPALFAIVCLTHITVQWITNRRGCVVLQD